MAQLTSKFQSMAGQELHRCAAIWSAQPCALTVLAEVSLAQVMRASQAVPAYLGLDAQDIGAVPQLSHAKAAWKVQGVQAIKEGIKVLLGAQLGDGASTQREVHARLNGQAVVAQGQDLQAGLELEGVCTWPSAC